MRIFLSYAAEDRPAAERVAAALRAAAHTVFFDQAALRGGDAFHERLREEIRRADAFVCLISVSALAKDSYVRTEIAVAVDRWPHPANRIIPVLLHDVPIEQLPPALQPLHVVPAAADPIVGVLTAVDAARRKRAATRRRRLLIALGVVVVVVLLALLARWLTPGRVRVGVASLDATSASVEPWPESFRASGWIDNSTGMTVGLGNVRLETNPDTIDLDVIGDVLFSSEALTPGARAAWEIGLRLHGKPTQSFAWQLCSATTGLGDVCTPEQQWQPTRPRDAATVVPVPMKLHRRARAVAADARGFVVAASEPNEILWLGSDGTLAAAVPARGEPVAVVISGDQVVAATRDPDGVQAWGRDDRAARWTVPFPSLAIDSGEGKQHASSRIQGLAATSTRVWVVTSQEQGEAVLAGLDPHTKQWAIPSFFNEVDFDPEQMRLTASGDRAWAGNTNVTPASLHTWTDTGSTTFGGHDVDVVSCTDDVAPASDGRAIIRTCEGELLEVDEDGGKLRIVRRWGALVARDEHVDPDAWSDARLASSDAGFVLGLTQGSVPRQTLLDARIAWRPRDGEARTLLQLPRGNVLALAASNDAVLAIIDSLDARGLVLLRLP